MYIVKEIEDNKAAQKEIDELRNQVNSLWIFTLIAIAGFIGCLIRYYQMFSYYQRLEAMWQQILLGLQPTQANIQGVYSSTQLLQELLPQFLEQIR